jgi:5,10-methylenetetrahydrofolate reductase
MSTLAGSIHIGHASNPNFSSTKDEKILTDLKVLKRKMKLNKGKKNPYLVATINLSRLWQ